MSQRAAIGLGDAARVINALGVPHGAQAAEIATFLGFSAPVPRMEQPALPAPTPAASFGVAPGAPAQPPTKVPPPPKPPKPKPPPSSTLGAELPSREVEATIPPSWWNAVDPVSNDAARLRPADSLFAPQAESEMLRAMLLSMAERGSLDIDRLVRWIARRRAITHVPRRSIRVTSSRVHVLLDRRDRMAMFHDDQDLLVERLRRVAGDAIDVESFVTHPREVGPLWQPRRWPVVGQGARVLIISDLHSSPETGCFSATWCALSMQLRQAQAETLVLSPVPSDHLDVKLARAFRVLYWDRTARPRDLRRLSLQRGTHG